MLGSWVAYRFVFASSPWGRFAFATEEKCRAVARSGRSVSFGQGCHAGFARRARVSTDALKLTLPCSASTAFPWALPKPSGDAVPCTPARGTRPSGLPFRCLLLEEMLSFRLAERLGLVPHPCQIAVVHVVAVRSRRCKGRNLAISAQRGVPSSGVLSV